MRRLSMSSAAKSPTEIELSEIWANRLPQVAAAQVLVIPSKASKSGADIEVVDSARG